MDYLILKSAHVTLVGLSFIGFALRTGGLLAGAGWARGRLARTLPHLLDSGLFVSALLLLALLHGAPLQQPWLIAKLCALLAYIFFGVVTLRLARNNPQRLAAALAAGLCFAYMLSAALSKSPWPFG